jgi:hypothetical protein
MALALLQSSVSSVCLEVDCIFCLSLQLRFKDRKEAQENLWRMHLTCMLIVICLSPSVLYYEPSFGACALWDGEECVSFAVTGRGIDYLMDHRCGNTLNVYYDTMQQPCNKTTARCSVF